MPVKTAIRLDTVVGSIKFSQSVVVLQLRVKGPQGLDPILRIKGYENLKERWRKQISLKTEFCQIGDIVSARWKGDGKYYKCKLMADHGKAFTCNWLDSDTSYRLVDKAHVKKNDVFCGAAISEEADWTNIADHVTSVDELRFQAPVTGWEIAELSVATAADMTSRVVVRVSPNGMVLDDISPAALVYDLNEMTALGYRLKPATEKRVAFRAPEIAPPVEGMPAESVSRLAHYRSSTSLLEMLRCFRWLPSPPGLKMAEIFEDLDTLLTALVPKNVDLVKPKKGVVAEVKAYIHFEEWYLRTLDNTRLDALEAAFEWWRRYDVPSPRPQTQQLIMAGQTWEGKYFCQSTITTLKLVITKSQGLTFTARYIFDAAMENKGEYLVQGVVDLLGRGVDANPIPDSWVSRPGNFVAVGLHGVVSHDLRRFSGTIPILGCDSFVLELKGRAKAKKAPKAPTALLEKNISALEKRITTLREWWRDELKKMMSAEDEKEPEKKESGEVIDSVAKLLELLLTN